MSYTIDIKHMDAVLIQHREAKTDNMNDKTLDM